MATSQSTMDFLLDQLAPLGGIRARKMFGEYALYCADKVVGLVCDDQLYIKVTDAGRAFVGDRFEEGTAYPGAKPSMLIATEHFDEGDWICDLIRITAAALPEPKPKTKRPRKKAAGKKQLPVSR
jgi:TfoX/Sxy family transcriptional regulator of competence genes